MKIKQYSNQGKTGSYVPNTRPPFTDTAPNYGKNGCRMGIDVLPEDIVRSNRGVMASYKLLSLLMKLKGDPLEKGRYINYLPDKINMDLTGRGDYRYCILASVDGKTWPDKHSRAIRAFMGERDD
jgi:hypothetical protein